MKIQAAIQLFSEAGDYFFQYSCHFLQAFEECNENNLAATVNPQMQFEARACEPRVVPPISEKCGAIEMSHLRSIALVGVSLMMFFAVMSTLTYSPKVHHSEVSLSSMAVCKPYVLDEAPQRAPDEPAKLYCVPAIMSEPEELHTEIQIVTEFLIT